MNYYLVKAHIVARRYMGEKDEKFEDIRLVKAEEAHFAGEKYLKYWEDKNDPYYKTYYARIDDILETIE